MRLHPALLPVLAGAALAAAAPAAHADTLLAPAPGSVNLASGGGYAAWATAASRLGGDLGWRLQLRLPTGQVVTPAVDDFAAPPSLDIGSGPFTSSGGAETTRRYVVYARGGAIYRMDLATQREQRYASISSSHYRQTAPSIDGGALTFVRTGGARDGVWAYDGKGHTKRLSGDTPGSTSFNGTRVGYARGDLVVVRKLSDRVALVYRTTSRPRSIHLTRYDAYWILGGGPVYRSPRFGSDEDTPGAPIRANRDLSPSLQSLTVGLSDPDLYLDGEGVKSVSPPLFHG